jgi:hypothetical protein
MDLFKLCYSNGKVLAAVDHQVFCKLSFFRSIRGHVRFGGWEILSDGVQGFFF